MCWLVDGWDCCVKQWFSKCVAQVSHISVSGNLLEMQIRRPYSRPMESDSLGVGSSNVWRNEPSR